MGLSCKSSVTLFSTIALNFLVILKTTYVFAQESQQTLCQSALVGGPIDEGKRKLSHLIKAAKDFVTKEGIRHRNALMEMFLELREDEVRFLITTRDFNFIAFNHNHQQIREIIVDYYIQKSNHILSMSDEEIDRIYKDLYNEITKEEVEEVFRALSILPSDSRSSKTHDDYHLERILEEIRTIKSQRKKNDQKVKTGRRVRVSEDVQKAFEALDVETVKERFQDFIEVLNIQDRSKRTERLKPYMPREGFSLANTNTQHAHIGGGQPTYIACYIVENDMVNVFFFGTHEQAGKSYKICKV